jgi:hypothetical protein
MHLLHNGIDRLSETFETFETLEDQYHDALVKRVSTKRRSGLEGRFCIRTFLYVAVRQRSDDEVAALSVRNWAMSFRLCRRLRNELVRVSRRTTD